MNSETLVWIYLTLIILSLIVSIVHTIRIKNKIRKLSNDALEVTPKEFFNIRSSSNDGRGKNIYQPNMILPVFTYYIIILTICCIM